MKSASNDRDIIVTVAVRRRTAQACGAYARVAMLAGFGTMALCDPNGVPLGVARRPMSLVAPRIGVCWRLRRLGRHTTR
jgi:hypothetical protein